MRKSLVFLMLSFSMLLGGCAGGNRAFVPDQDTGYEVDYDNLGGTPVSTESLTWGSLAVGSVSASYIVPPVSTAAAAAGGVASVALFGVTALISCSATNCQGHRPYGDILMSGNVLRGTIFIPAGPLPDVESWATFHAGYAYKLVDHDFNASIQYPYDGWDSPEWLASAYVADSMHEDLEPDDLVDVYFLHDIDLELTAIREEMAYYGVVLHRVCKADDDDCMEKYRKEEDNFILGRWESREAFLADYERNDKFPN